MDAPPAEAAEPGLCDQKPPRSQMSLLVPDRDGNCAAVDSSS